VTGEERERLMRLCEEASVEQDSQRLLELVRQINDLLEAKGALLKKRDKERAAGR
jgi:hypothetical protein